MAKTALHPFLIALTFLLGGANAATDLSEHFADELIEYTVDGDEVTETLEITDPNITAPPAQESIPVILFEPDKMTVDVRGIREDEEEAGFTANSGEVDILAVLVEYPTHWEISIDTENGDTLTATFDELGELTLSTNSPAAWNRAAEVHVLLVEIEAWGGGHFSSAPPMDVIRDVVIPNFVGQPPAP